jgi:uncharacterized membrane protein
VAKRKKKERRPARPATRPAGPKRVPKPGAEARPVARRFLALCDRYGLYVVLVLAVAYAVAFCAISHFKYRNFNYSDFDLAIFSNAVWNTAHGHFMYTAIRSGCYFKDHVPVILLALVPLYRLFPSPLTLLYAQSVMLAAGAVPLFLLARRETNGFWGILFALMYLLYPAVGFINLFEFHPLAFVPALLLFAFYFFRAKRYVPFLVFVGLAMLCREEVSLTVMMIGLYALIARRRWHWIVAPAAAGLIWFFVCFNVIIPHFNKGENIYGKLYGELGSTPGEVLKTAITKPGKTLAVAFRKEPAVIGKPRLVNKPRYLRHIFTPTSFLALANPEALLITAPQFALNLLVDTDIHRSPPTIYFQYTATLIPVLFFSSVLGLARLLRIRVLKQFWILPAAAVLLVSGATWIRWSPQLGPARTPLPPDLSLSQNTDWPPRILAQTRYHRPDNPDDVDSYRALLDAVPKGAPTVGTFRFLPSLSSRRTLASFHYVYMGHEKVAAEREYVLPDEVTYALLDLRPWALWAVQFAAPQDAGNFYHMLETGDWGIVARRGQLVLLRKNAPELPKLVQRVTEPTVASRFTSEYNGVVKLLGIDARVEDLGDKTQVRIRSAWEYMAPVQFRLLVDFALFDAEANPEQAGGREGAVVAQTTADFGELALAPNVWLEGERVEVEYAMLIPSTVPDGRYVIGLLCFPAGFQPARISVTTRGGAQDSDLNVTLTDENNHEWVMRLPAGSHLGGGYRALVKITLGEGAAP